MPELLLILFKINLVLLLFAVAYYLVLRRLTFYTVNRAFLMLGIVFSTIYPFINLTDFFNRQVQLDDGVAAFVPKLNEKVTQLVPSSFITEYSQVIGVVFCLGVVFMAFRLIVQFVSLYNVHQKSKPGAIANYKVRILDEVVSPFSFWQNVYINPALHQEKELQTILAHESIHVKEWHSVDIILAELSVVFYWFNPGVWLMKRAVKENLEFITDEKIIKKGVDKKVYQYSLLDVGNLTAFVPIVNNFNLSDLKKRIRMMNVKRSSRLTLSRYLFILPVLLVTTLAFTIDKKDIKEHLMPSLQQVIMKSTSIILNPDTLNKDKKEKVVNLRLKRKETPIIVKNDTAIKVAVTNVLYTFHITTKKTDSLPAEVKQITLIARTDHIKMDSVLKGSVQGVRLFKDELEPNNVARSTVKDIKIVGYRHKGSPIANEGASYIVDGKRILLSELGNLNPQDINEIKIEKAKGAPASGKTIILIEKKNY